MAYSRFAASVCVSRLNCAVANAFDVGYGRRTFPQKRNPISAGASVRDSLSVHSLPISKNRQKSSSSDQGTEAVSCGRCAAEVDSCNLRAFGDKLICKTCFEATVELAAAAIKVMPTNEPGRLCKNCRAIRDPSFGSAWCGMRQLGDARARICANFVPLKVETARARMTSGRVKSLEIWRTAAMELRSTLGENNYETWLSQVEPVDLKDDCLVLVVPDEFTRDWLDQRLHEVILGALTTIGYPNLGVTYRVEALPSPRLGEAEDDRKKERKAAFNPNYTFERFVVGPGNELAQASAWACVERPGTTYNPLVIYGGVGVGKTHLLQAIAQEAIDKDRGEVLYVTSEAFTNELILAIREGSTGAFRDRYRKLDFFLLDDIQFIAGKEATQEEFFHTFNALHQAGKQIVLTSDRPPAELRVLQDRLRSRFGWGLTCDMRPPDLETRINIVRSKAELRGKRLPEAVVHALATRADRNVRELEGALNSVLALSDLFGQEPGMEIVRTVLGGSAQSDRCAADDVLQAVSSYYQIKPSDLSGPRREKSVCFARHIAMFLLREDAKLSLIAIGDRLGGRNHSTVIYSCDKVARDCRCAGRSKEDVEAIRHLIYE